MVRVPPPCSPVKRWFSEHIVPLFLDPEIASPDNPRRGKGTCALCMLGEYQLMGTLHRSYPQAGI